ncbi:MAG: indole-3-glycerol phosphate synthase TrpC [Desulfobacteraceae bacterium]|nr:indole-3-glycerol phosphate synthase TrpC [Desulfobacteraceae bacterium]
MAFQGFLKTIVEIKSKEIDQNRSQVPLNRLRKKAEEKKPVASFAVALAESRPDNVGIIAEIKKASPSKGDIKPDLDVELYAKQYTKAGACAISVLTESHFFKGSLDDLELVCQTTDLPVLRKDFTISSYQIYQAKSAGASSILLITTLLSNDQLRDYLSLARELEMEPLVEINSEKEFEKAFSCGAAVVGINNRNLQTLQTDLTVSKRIAPIIPEDILLIEASGISSARDIRAGVKAGMVNFLVGESIVRAKDTEKFIKTLIQANSDKNDS